MIIGNNNFNNNNFTNKFNRIKKEGERNKKRLNPTLYSNPLILSA